MSDRGNDKVRMKALLAAHLAYKKHILSGLKEYGIMPGHPKIMHYIMLHEGCRQKDIANNCYVESATLSSVLSNMERHGLIERRRSSDDKRSYTIYPKDSAKPIFDAVLDQFDKTESTANPQRKSGNTLTTAFQPWARDARPEPICGGFTRPRELDQRGSAPTTVQRWGRKPESTQV